MSDVILSYRGRQIREPEVVFLRDLIAQNPDLSRRALSIKVCEIWNWVQPNGQLRDQVCRSLMLALHRAGHIELPAPRIKAVNNAIRHRRITQLEFCEDQSQGPWPQLASQLHGSQAGQGSSSHPDRWTSVSGLPEGQVATAPGTRLGHHRDGPTAGRSSDP